MKFVTLSRSKTVVLSATLIAIGLVGCQRGPATSRVRGKVLLTNGSVPSGGVRAVKFEPAKESTAEIRKAASGIIQDDGTFEMYTRKPGDGVYHGDYNVTFTVWKAPREPVSLIAEKYTYAATTPYQITVDRNMDDLLFEIEPIE